MGSIRRPSGYGSGGTKDIKFIQYVDGRETQIHELWCLVLENITRKVYLAEQVEVGSETMGEFRTNYLTKNGRRILIIGNFSINGSVQFLGIPNFSGEVDCRLLKNCNLPLIPNSGYTVIPPIRTGELSRGKLKEMSVSPGVLPSMTVRLTCLGVRLTCALLRVMSVMTYFVVGVDSV